MKNPLLKTSAALAILTIFSASFVSAADEEKSERPNQAETLKQFDANGDGKLDQAERDAARKHMHSMRGSNADGRGANRADRSDGGRGQGGRGALGGQGGRGNPMAQFDTDDDGKLSDAERKAAEPAMREFTQNNARAMQQFDKDGDGKLNDKEWAAARKVVEQRTGRAGGSRGGEGRGRGGEGQRRRGGN